MYKKLWKSGAGFGKIRLFLGNEALFVLLTICSAKFSLKKRPQ